VLAETVFEIVLFSGWADCMITKRPFSSNNNKSIKRPLSFLSHVVNVHVVNPGRMNGTLLSVPEILTQTPAAEQS
jgi:hypothetical protein